ncbi:hypothetical protein MMC26_003230 [Xylographa opegraphella]|nr:hypothetical protein [Xylographa opegraphella]
MAPNPRKTVSISAIFKRHGKPKKDTPKDFGHSGTISKISRNRKHEKTSEHSLAAKFSENIELSRLQIFENANAALDSTHHILLERLASTSAISANFIEETKTFRDDLTKPLAQETLQFRGSEGEPTGTASLGDRMKTFKRRIAKEEKELELLWKDWAEVQRLIMGVSVKTLEHEAVASLGVQPSGKVERDSHRFDTMEISNEIMKEKKRQSQEINSWSLELIQTMYAAEKEMDTRTHKQRQEFLTALGGDF